MYGNFTDYLQRILKSRILLRSYFRKEIMNIEEIKWGMETLKTVLHPKDYDVLVEAVSQGIRVKRNAEMSEQVSKDLQDLDI